MSEIHLWVRSEVKVNEKRVAITPEDAKSLLATGNFRITVERSPADPPRSIPDEEYEKVGCTMVDSQAWVDLKGDDPNVYVLGLKELPEGDGPLPQQHIYFAHAFKNQTGWKELLSRFHRAKGSVLDIEFLTDDRGRRVAAFGREAGFAGAALGVLNWVQQQLGEGPLGKVSDTNEKDLVEHVKHRLEEVTKAKSIRPRAIVIGALGRVGRGACELLEAVGISEGDIAKWDLAETKAGGPFPEILGYDVFVNCVYLSGKTPHFLTMDMIRDSTSERRLSNVVDVSCDYTSPYNPIPIYHSATTFEEPTVRILEGERPVDVISIDHLPSMIPREASTSFSACLTPTLKELPNAHTNPVWTRARNLFVSKCTEAAEALAAAST